MTSTATAKDLPFLLHALGDARQHATGYASLTGERLAIAGLFSSRLNKEVTVR
jgi:hypothetical protein